MNNTCTVLKNKRITIPVGGVEMFEGGNTIWVQGIGGTTIRISFTGRIRRFPGEFSFIELVANGNINFCVSDDSISTEINDLETVIVPVEGLPEELEVTGAHILIPARRVDFVDEGNSIEIKDQMGRLVLKINCSGKIEVEQCGNSPFSHSDINIAGDLRIEGLI